MNDEIERSLRAPGSPAELAGEESYRAMFRAERATQPRPAMAAVPGPGHRTARRLGTGATIAMVFAVASTGVAAAYSAKVGPVRSVVHSVLGPLGVPVAEPQPVEPDRSPAPDPQRIAVPAVPVVPGRDRQPSGAFSVDPSPSIEPTPTETPTEEASVDPSPTVSDDPTPTPDPTPTESPSETPTSPSSEPTPSATPTATGDPSPTTPPETAPASLSIGSVGAQSLVAPGGSAVVTGQVATANGSPARGVLVALQLRGTNGWRQLSAVRSGRDGSVSVSTGPIRKNAVLRFQAQRVRSGTRQLFVQPTLSASTVTEGSVATVTARAAGGQVGDTVVLLAWQGGRLVQQGSGRLGNNGVAVIEVAAPATRSTYVVRLPATVSHAVAEAKVAVDGAVAEPPPLPE